MFDGITEDTIGGFGFSGHGAAGFELDRADKRLGTPANAIVVANKCDLPNRWKPTEKMIQINARNGDGLEKLYQAIVDHFGITARASDARVWTQRQANLLSTIHV